MVLTEALEFFGRLFPQGLDARAAVVAFPSKQVALVTADASMLADAAQRAAEGGEDAYFSACALRSDFAGPGRGKKEDLAFGTSLWVDVDVAGPGHKATNLPPTLDDALDLLAAIPFDPGMIVETGGGLHAYWLLDHPVPFGARGGRSQAGKAFARLVGALQAKIRAAGALKGWHVDDTSDVTRILRAPGSINYKVAGDPRTVQVLANSGGTVSLGEACLALGIPPGLFDVGEGDVGASSVSLPPPSSPGVLDLASLKAKLTTGKHAQTFLDVFAGRSFAPPGDRDRALNRTCAILAFAAPMATAMELADVLLPSLAAWACEPGAKLTTEEEYNKAVEKLERSLVDARKGLASSEALRKVVGAIKTEREAALPKYTEEELDKLSDDLKCSREELDERWIVQYKSAYFVLENGRYHPAPHSREELETDYQKWFRRAPFDLWVLKPSGEGMRPLKLSELLHEHATVAFKHEGSLTIQHSYYDGQVFREALFPLRDLSPRFDPKIDEWLDIIDGGEEHGKVKDWVATVMELDRYSSALYLFGPPSTGKTLLAEGLARLWTTAGPAELSRTLENFNEDIGKCPLIFADEQLPPNLTGKRNSTELRNLIAANSRTLNRKYLPQVSVVGHVRLMLAANNDNLLDFGGDDLSPDDLEAYKERFLIIDTTRAAGLFETYPNRRAPKEEWVDNDLIARHALWLNQNRKMDRTGRFLVAGTPSIVHSQLAIGKRNSPVVEWMARYLSAPDSLRRFVEQSGNIRVGNGEVLVNASAIIDNWATFVKNEKAPTTVVVGKTLASIAKGSKYKRGVKKKIGGRNFTSIDSSFVFGWIEKYGVGDDERVKALIDREVEE